jgi:hypothetical protein
VACPISHDRTRPVDKNALWTLFVLKSDAGCTASGQFCSASDRSVQQREFIASGHVMTEKITFCDRWKLNERNLKWDMWRALGGGAQCNRTLCPRPVRSASASGQHDSSNTLFLTALLFGVAYKYMFERFGMSLLNILTL